jgi:hypothetical protein
MNRARLASWLIFAAMACGCRQSGDAERPGALGRGAPGPELAVITCKPAFKLVERPEIVVTDQEGNRHDAFLEWLVLDDGQTRHHIRWGTPPVSHGPVQLQQDRTYTFSVATVPGREGPVSRVVRIVEGGKVIYEAPAGRNLPDLPGTRKVEILSFKQLTFPKVYQLGNQLVLADFNVTFRDTETGLVHACTIRDVVSSAPSGPVPVLEAKGDVVEYERLLYFSREQK